MATKDSAFVTFEGLRNYTDALKKYVDFKFVPVPSDCEKLQPTAYTTGTTLVVLGWGLPTGFSDAVLGTTYEYYFVEDNVVVGHCKSVRGEHGYYTLTWLDGTTKPENITCYTTESQALAWKLSFGFQVQFDTVTLTASSNTSNVSRPIYIYHKVSGAYAIIRYRSIYCLRP